MIKIHNLEELRQIAKGVSKSNEGEVAMLDLSEEVVNFLHSIGGKNRNLIANNLAALYSVIDSGKWDKNESVITVNASLNWMPCGHHRIEVIHEMKKFGLQTMLKVLPDKDAESVYLYDDVIVGKRTSARQAMECFGIGYSKDIATTIKYIAEMTGRVGYIPIPEEIRDYWLLYGDTLISHGYTTQLPRFNQKRGRHIYIPRGMYGIAIYLGEQKNPFEGEAWRIIDEIRNKDTNVLAAKIIRASILEFGQSNKTDAMLQFIKTIVIGMDNIKAETQLYIRSTENYSKFRSAIGFTNHSDRKDVLIGSKKYFEHLISDKIKGAK